MSDSSPHAAAITRVSGEPRSRYRQWRRQLQGGEGLLLVNFTLDRYWLDRAAPIPLTALYCVQGDRLHVAVTDQTLTAHKLPPLEQYVEWTRRYRMVEATDNIPLELAALPIDKPWGRELWYSGVEARGVCEFTADGGRTPIPWLQAVLPDDIAGKAGEALLLLKILDPLATPVLGDLYFELHEEKREVYVVTHVDREAWPDGVGYIRYGFDRERLAAWGDEARFRAAYLAAVRDYEQVRRGLDGMPAGEPADAGLLAQEQALRETMNAFTGLLPLRVGDVVEVPLRVPHSLQHGVRTVEFQTPSYERKILSFAQKVLTQDHWDTAAVIDSMHLLPPEPDPFPLCHRGGGAILERIVDFPDFEVRRGTLEAGARWQFETLPVYALVMVVSGVLALAGRRFRAEQAVLIPASWQGFFTAAEGCRELVFLLALPRG